jgi:hypothetical protein
MVDLALISATTGAVVRSAEIYQSIEAVKETLKRDPDIAADRFLSWGNVTLPEIERLILHIYNPDQETMEIVMGWSREFSGEEYFWSVYFDEEQNV